LLKIAEQDPLVFVIEDLQWVDPSTVEHLSLLLDQGAQARIIIILAFRPTFQPPLSAQSRFTEIILNRLARQQVEAMIDKVAGGKALPADILDQLVLKTDGIPLFVEELTKMVLESGRLEEEDERYVFPGPFPDLAVPATLQDSLMARLDRLGTVKEVVQLGAVLGREFSFDVINAVSPLTEATLRDELTKLVDLEVLHQVGTPPQARYSFKQALIQDAAYQSLLRSTRQQYHQRIAETLGSRFSETAEAHPELLAQHFTEANMTREAIAYWLKAGQMSTRRSANPEAISHLRKGIEIVKKIPDDAARHEQELMLQVALGVPLTATRGFASPDVEKVYARARELCDGLGDTPQLFPVLRGLWLFHLVRAELKSAYDFGTQLLRLAESVQDPALLLSAHLALGLTLCYQGRFVSALEHLEQGIALYDSREHHRLAYEYGDDPGVVCSSYSALVHWMLGHPAKALDRDREALALARRISHPFSLALALNFSARLHQCLREEATTRERAEETMQLATDQGFAHWLTTGTILRGWALAMLGKGDEGVAQIQEGVSDWQAIGAGVAGPHCLAMLAEAFAKAGQVDEGLNALADALAAAEKSGEGLYEPELHRLKGELLLTSSQENRDQAERCYARALDLARHQSARSLELRAAVSLGRLRRSQGRKREAAAALGEVYSSFTEGLDTPDLREAQELLAELA
jgi:predicted ATPase